VKVQGTVEACSWLGGDGFMVIDDVDFGIDFAQVANS